MLAFYLCISPWLIGLVLFYIVPIFTSLSISFNKWDLITAPKSVGLRNYREAFFEDRLFWHSLKITVLYTFSYVPLDLIFGLAFAMLLNRNIKGIRIFRTIIYLPSVLAGVAYVVLWMWMLNPDAGLINTLLSYVGITGPRWLQDPTWALPSLVFMSLWGIGRSMIIFLAGLQSIPRELYEAAAIDSAGKWRRFFQVTLPLLTPAILFNLLFGIIMTFQSFTNVFVATNGGPLDSTLFYVLYLYRNAFEYLRMGYASALAWILLIIVMVVTLLIFNTSGKWVFYQGGSE